MNPAVLHVAAPGSGRMPFRGHRLAVIDIGSNSVRLVIFEGGGRVPTVVFNEKILCGLGRRDGGGSGGGGEGRSLNPKGVPLALSSISRFAALIAAMDVETVDVVATAAIREADDGAAFVARIEQDSGLTVRVLTGPEEAEYAALGVVAADPHATGIIGDLGGGSLELIRVEEGCLRERATVPLGPFRLLDESGGKREKAQALIDRTLSRIPWLAEEACPAFYAVGGSWRTIARLQMAMIDYPLRVIHHYRLDLDEAMELTGLVARLSRQSLSRTAGVSRRRIDVLPMSAEVLHRLLDILRPRDLVFSAFGLREGVNFAHLDAEARAVDPLLSAVRDLAVRTGRFREHGDEIAEWVTPLFEEKNVLDARILLAACLLSDTGWRHHPDYRAGQSFFDILRNPILPVDHQDRVFLALAAYARYTAAEPGGSVAEAAALVDPEVAHRARAIGMACRLAHTLSGGVRGLLSRFPISMRRNGIVLQRTPGDALLVGDVVVKRFEALCRHLGKSATIEDLG